jgi:hypothetical protein
MIRPTPTYWCVTCDDVPVKRWGYQCPACSDLPEDEQERDYNGDCYDQDRNAYEQSIGG